MALVKRIQVSPAQLSEARGSVRLADAGTSHADVQRKRARTFARQKIA
jgi:hypothetical protein